MVGMVGALTTQMVSRELEAFIPSHRVQTNLGHVQCQHLYPREELRLPTRGAVLVTKDFRCPRNWFHCFQISWSCRPGHGRADEGAHIKLPVLSTRCNLCCGTRLTNITPINMKQRENRAVACKSQPIAGDSLLTDSAAKLHEWRSAL